MQSLDGRRQQFIRFDQTKICGKLARAETRLMEALPPAGAAIECVEMLAVIVLGARMGSEFEMRLDHIFDIDEHGRGTLLSILIDKESQTANVVGIHRLFDRCDRRLVAHLVSPDRLKADRLQHRDRIDDPVDCRLPVNRLQNSPRGGRRHHVVRDTFDLHFRPREAREIA